ncbi:unnamed protein product, partial [Toxocara canis]|uniref:EF-hand_10 domain-containing protein n=1 Tax=Toxocara canis TaxID=6265 RepID=A0A183VBM4_TOXCA
MEHVNGLLIMFAATVMTVHGEPLTTTGKLSFNEVWKLLKRLNLQISQDYAMATFMDADTKKTETSVGDRVLDEDEFLAFFERLTHRPDLEHAFSCLAQSTTVLSPSTICANSLRMNSRFPASSAVAMGQHNKPGHGSVFQNKDHPLSH